MNEDQYSYISEVDYEMSRIVYSERDDYSGRCNDEFGEYDFEVER